MAVRLRVLCLAVRVFLEKFISRESPPVPNSGGAGSRKSPRIGGFRGPGELVSSLPEASLANWVRRPDLAAPSEFALDGGDLPPDLIPPDGLRPAGE